MIRYPRLVSAPFVFALDSQIFAERANVPAAIFRAEVLGSGRELLTGISIAMIALGNPSEFRPAFLRRPGTSRDSFIGTYRCACG
jgi:hypothetical protein